MFVKFKGWFETAEHVGIAMELFKEGDLQRYLDKHDKARGEPLLPEEQAKEITVQVLEGLVMMHHEGIVHRDLKPAVSCFWPPLLA